MSAGRRWTDEEMGFVESHPDWTPRQMATYLDRGPRDISDMRYRLNKGWVPRETNVPWTDEEDEIVRSHPYLTNAQRAALLPGRSASGVRQRRAVIGLGPDAKNKDPHRIANRPLIAKTCLKCGLLLDARWFKRGKAGCWNSRCGHCSQSPRVPSGKSKSSKSSMAQWYAEAQRITVERATRSGHEWTTRDLEVLSDPRLTNIEKALQLGRTYAATSTQCAMRGYSSHHPGALGDADAQQWFIYAPRAEDLLWEAS